MLKIVSMKIALLLAVFITTQAAALAQDPIEKTWYSQEKTSKIQVYKAKDGKFYGKIVWLKEPMINGKAKVDDKNPDDKKRTQPIVGLIILRGLEKDGDKEYNNGTVYDPKNGKTYSCKITHKGNMLDLRGYVGISMLGRTSTWTLAE